MENVNGNGREFFRATHPEVKEVRRAARARRAALVLAIASLITGAAAARQPLAGKGPPVPYEDVGACPFEGCTYREWTATDRVTVRKDRKAQAPVVYSIPKGERVTALTGVVVTVKAGRAQFRRSVNLQTASGPLHLDAGQTLFLLTYRGEGVTQAWFGGRVYDEVDGSTSFFDDRCKEKDADCDATLVAQPQSVWWVQVRNAKGEVGWTNEPQKFDGKDALGGEGR